MVMQQISWIMSPYQIILQSDSLLCLSAIHTCDHVPNSRTTKDVSVARVPPRLVPASSMRSDGYIFAVALIFFRKVAHVKITV